LRQAEVEAVVVMDTVFLKQLLIHNCMVVAVVAQVAEVALELC
jgi:hypothetical protein